MQLETPRRRRNIVSLTPLIDVVFILLVFFMLASSFQQWSAFQLEVPANTQSEAEDADIVLIELATDGGLRVDGAPTSMDGFVQRVQAARATDPTRAISVMPAADVPLQRIVEVMDRLAQAGVRDASLVKGPAQ